MSMGGMSGMGHMAMGSGPDLFYLQRMYWAVVGSAIAAATLANGLNRVLAFQRLRDSTLTPSKPKSLFFNTYATLTALVREASYVTLPSWSIAGRTIHFAPLGPVSIILANLVVVLVFCFYKLDTKDEWKWEDIGYRTGFVAIAQLPLIFLLAGRQNIIGFLVGMSYERLNWFHRWIARTLWLTTTIHMGFWFRNWARYEYISYQLANDPLTQRGFAAWCILSFIVISSAAPIRRLSYEFFVLQHLVTFAGFIAAVWLHAPDEVKVWVWIPIGLVIFDRVARYAWATYANLSIFHPSKQQSSPNKHALWAHRASFTPLPGNITRITIPNPGITWSPGQHVFLTCHAIVPLQSHPFTIASIPSDNKMEFLVRAEKGGTRRLFHYASKTNQVLASSPTTGTNSSPRAVFIDGPYGRIRPLRQFDSVVLLAGGMGATFTLPCLRDIVSGWKAERAGGKRLTATKRIRFVWVIKSRAQLSWLDTQLQSALADVEECQREQPDLIREIELSIYVTCDEKLEQSALPLKPRSPAQPEPVTIIADEKQKIPLSDEKSDKKDQKDDEISIRSVDPSADSGSGSGSGGCLPSGGCCCTHAIEDEDEITPHKCECSGHAAPAPEVIPAYSEKETQPVDVKQPPPPAVDLPLLSGRPQPRTIIRKVLEKAEGESAVVVCGPHGLSDDVRRSVVGLSDERAVHKGTGAQGIYLHVEKFGW